MPLTETSASPRLWVHRAVTRHLLALPAVPWEVGGWLLGYWTADGRDLFLTHATPPGPRGSRFGVHISGAGHRERFDAAWQASQGHVTFLGDWHTHPGGPASPSTRDKATMEDLAEDENYGTPEPLIAVVATPSWPWLRRPRAIAFFVRRRDGVIDRLSQRDTDYLPSLAASVPAWSWPGQRRWPRRG